MEDIKNQIYVGQSVWLWEQDIYAPSQTRKVYYTVTDKYSRFFTAERQVKGYTKKTSFLYAQVIQGEVHLV